MNRGGHIPRVHVEGPLAAGAEVRIEGDKAHHLRNVLRLRAGDGVILFDGGGGEYDATVADLGRGLIELSVDRYRPAHRESPLRLVLAQGIARGDRMDFAVAKAVELGVHAIRPLFTDKGQVRLDGERLARKLSHWRRVAESAAEQSGRERVPEVQEPTPLGDWLAVAPGTTRLVLDPAAESGPASLPRTVDACLLIGPESGLSGAELEAASAAGFSRIRLGPRVLRTETAGPAALAILQALWGDMG
ncbi:hypothetical protein PC39_07069 [Salinisphaera sp. PC39]|uniref:16S rRNA (uracil(1498)-N(3))-methyltransferase n=1 Tax=Salinisphaera sp. PC39 TaxID=1304156 RepID=UPI0033425DFB